jgi:cytochrome c oxidase subunit 2
MRIPIGDSRFARADKPPVAPGRGEFNEGVRAVGRFWSLLFLMVPVLGVGIFVWAIVGAWPLAGHWLPEDVSEHGRVIDGLFYFILVLTGLTFAATGIALFVFLWKYDAGVNAQPVRFVHGSHTLEIVWSILTAATLLFIAIFQMDAWAGSKMRRPVDPGADGIAGTADDPMLPGPDGKPGTADDIARPKPPTAEVTGRQFEWRIRYPGRDGIIGTRDDLYTVNDLHVPVGEEVVLDVRAEDVLHSFFLPHLRVKQDVVPGMRQYVWFQANREGRFDIVCAELCGWGHYKMKGRITIESRASFERYLAALEAEQEKDEFVNRATGE